MKHLRFCFDVVSPYAYLAFERLPQALAGLSVEVSYQPCWSGAKGIRPNIKSCSPRPN